MKKYFDLLLDLLELESQDWYDEILDIIEKNKDKKIEFYHQYWFIFEWYHKLLKKEISPEEFLQIWDITSNIILDLDKLDSISFLKSNPKLDFENIYIFDSLAEWIVDKLGNIYYY